MILGIPLTDGTILTMDGAGASAGAGAGVIHITDGATTILTATTLIMDTIMVIVVIMATTPTVQEAVTLTTEDEAVMLITTEPEEVTQPSTIRLAQDLMAEEEIMEPHQAQEAVANITIQAQA